MKAIAIALTMFLTLGLATAELREFTNANGQKLEAELVSHKGGKIKLRRADGKEFEVLPNVFSPDDQIFIKNWLDETPETVSYNFRFKADRKKVSGRNRKVSYYRVKNEKWVYDVNITNLSRDSVSNLTVKYRQFRSNEAEDDYRAMSDEASDWIMDKGEVKVAAAVDYGRSMSFQTMEMQIDHVDYEFSTTDWDDEILGLLVRIEDAKGNVVGEWAEPVNTLKGRTWENTAPGKGKGSGNVIIK